MIKAECDELAESIDEITETILPDAIQKVVTDFKQDNSHMVDKMVLVKDQMIEEMK
jgi:hypothetical protein